MRNLFTKDRKSEIAEMQIAADTRFGKTTMISRPMPIRNR